MQQAIADGQQTVALAQDNDRLKAELDVLEAAEAARSA
jgi:hypothetical protein